MLTVPVGNPDTGGDAAVVGKLLLFQLLDQLGDPDVTGKLLPFPLKLADAFTVKLFGSNGPLGLA
jgi:hypothetical protein